MVQQQRDQVTDSFRLADCQELLTFYLYFDQSKTSRRDNVKIYLVDQRGPATIRNLFWAMLSFLDNYVTKSTLVTCLVTLGARWPGHHFCQLEVQFNLL